jgi:hypothetical protein
MCSAFVTMKVFQWFPEAEILVLLGRESLVNPEA